MPTATVTSKGQITLPKEIRDGLGVQAGDRVLFWRDVDGRVIVEAETVDVRTLRGMLGGGSMRLSIEEMNAVIANAAAGRKR
jgi:AbrB family looped-hinge helix DNA binding protein